MRYLDLFSEREQLHIEYQAALLEGASDHVNYRFGNTRPPPGWSSVEPEPPGNVVAERILGILERCPALLLMRMAGATALDVCAHVASEPADIERIMTFLSLLLDHPDPGPERHARTDNKDASVDDLLNIAHDSTRGRVAITVMTLMEKHVESGTPLPEKLRSLPEHLARDPALSVRAFLLTRLPYVTHHDRALGLRLFDHMFAGPQDILWVIAERMLYYQYRHHFDWVRPLLDRMVEEAPDHTGESWGRIAALAMLAGHMERRELFARLAAMGSDAAWQGAAQVFAANLDDASAGSTCIAAIRKILDEAPLSAGLLDALERGFTRDRAGRLIDGDLARAFLRAHKSRDNRYSFRWFLQWLEAVAKRDPLQALGLCEVLMEQDAAIFRNTPYGKELINALALILADADQSDDKELIRRAIAVQDHFLRAGIYGMDEYMSAAERLEPP